MSLSRNKINPLNVLGMRRLGFIPNHFSTVLLPDRDIDIKLVDHWISYNLNSRYAIRSTIALDSNKKLVEVKEIGIEDPKELTMFTLGCPHIHT